jgi:SAM-dependent methyltransferase
MFGSIKLKINKLGRQKTCYICGQNFSSFLPYQGLKDESCFVQTLDIIGSDMQNFSCPHCWSHDRERHLFMYLDALGLWEKLKGDVLHFAPERHLCAKIRELNPRRYIMGDLFSDDPSVEKIDVTAIDYPDKSFDFVICNHVLEHIEDIDTALKELFRILKRGGYAILQTPYSAILENSFKDKNIHTDALRKVFYGQEDHVRVFGQDLFNMLKAQGFTLELQRHQIVLAAFDCQKFGVNCREDLILVQKCDV